MAKAYYERPRESCIRIFLSLKTASNYRSRLSPPWLPRREWRHEIAGATNPVAELCRTRLSVTGNPRDLVWIGDLQKLFNGGVGARFVQLVRSYFDGVSGVRYFESKKMLFEGKSGTKRNVLSGVEIV